MGQENSQINPDVPSVSLSSCSLDAVVDYIKKRKDLSIVVMTGTGISTSARIPDFWSPNTRLCSNLVCLNLPSAKAVFSIDYFCQNPNPFYVLAKELYPGQF
jgi:NAD-dependent histone deacetylase SIR2